MTRAQEGYQRKGNKEGGSAYSSTCNQIGHSSGEYDDILFAPRLGYYDRDSVRFGKVLFQSSSQLGYC
jgi:hypothetical protein